MRSGRGRLELGGGVCDSKTGPQRRSSFLSLPRSPQNSGEAAREQGVDGPASIGLKEARSGAAEERLPDAWLAGGLPGAAVPAEPGRARLIEDVDRLVEHAGEFGGDSGTTGDGVIRVDLADHEDLLSVVDLVPDGLQDVAEELRVRVLAVHQLAQITEAHVAVAQLCPGQVATAALPGDGVAIEGEIDFVDAMALGRGAECRLRAVGRAAKTDAILAFHLVNLFDVMGGGAFAKAGKDEREGRRGQQTILAQPKLPADPREVSSRRAPDLAGGSITS